MYLLLLELRHEAVLRRVHRNHEPETWYFPLRSQRFIDFGIELALNPTHHVRRLHHDHIIGQLANQLGRPTEKGSSPQAGRYRNRRCYMST